MRRKALFLFLTFILVMEHCIPLKTWADESHLSDIEGHWAEKEIKRLVAREVISGYPDGTFRPNDPITRAEFVSLLVKAFNLKSNDESAKDQVFYKDTIKLNSKGLYTWMHWALPEIQIATVREIMTGTGEDMFSPDEPLTREQLAVIIDNFIYKDIPFVLQKLSQSNLPSVYAVERFKDAFWISDWADVKINRMVLLGMMEGDQNQYFSPQKATTRAEAAVILTRLLDKTSNQGVTIFYSGYSRGVQDKVQVPDEIKEWVDTGNEEKQVWHRKDGVYVAVKRGGAPNPCYDIELKSLERTADQTTITFQSTYPVIPYACRLSVETHVMVVKLPRTEEVEVVILD